MFDGMSEKFARVTINKQYTNMSHNDTERCVTICQVESTQPGGTTPLPPTYPNVCPITCDSVMLGTKSLQDIAEKF